jgi:hypothetical protein
MNKWCPFSRVVVSRRDGAAAGNRGFGPGREAEDTRCLGSRCMAWRVAPYDNGHGFCGLVPVVEE